MTLEECVSLHSTVLDAKEVTILLLDSQDDDNDPTLYTNVVVQDSEDEGEQQRNGFVSIDCNEQNSATLDQVDSINNQSPREDETQMIPGSSGGAGNSAFMKNRNTMLKDDTETKVLKKGKITNI